MSLRFASLDVLGKGAWKVSSSSPFIPSGLDASRVPGSHQAPPAAATQAEKKPAKAKKQDLLNPEPEELLVEFIKRAGIEGAVTQHKPLDDRRFRIDIAFPDCKLAIECDGWSYHGRHLDDFKKERERQNLLVLAGWRILRFPAGQIRQEPEAVIDQIKQALATFREAASINFSR